MCSFSAQEIYAQLYDLYVTDWTGEIDFYRDLIANLSLSNHNVLEIACGTGRVAIRLAQEGWNLTGMDISPELLAVARQKSAGMDNIQWVLGDMQSFEIGAEFGIAIIPGHSFQFMLTPDQQMECLENIQRHLVPGGVLIVHLDHQDYRWLAGLLDQQEHVFKKGDLLIHPETKNKYQKSNYWTFDSVSQTATNHIQWEEIGEDGKVLQTYPMEPMRLHCVFRFEMEHLLVRAGFEIQALYGDFFKEELKTESENMIWVARKPAV